MCPEDFVLEEEAEGKRKNNRHLLKKGKRRRRKETLGLEPIVRKAEKRGGLRGSRTGDLKCSMHYEGHLNPREDNCGDDCKNEKKFCVKFTHAQYLRERFLTERFIYILQALYRRGKSWLTIRKQYKKHFFRVFFPQGKVEKKFYFVPLFCMGKRKFLPG